MLKHCLPIVLVLLVAPAAAQRDGSINVFAPTVKQSIAWGSTRIVMTYTALAWGHGAMIKKAMEKGGYDTRRNINDLARSRPSGGFGTTVDLVCGDVKIPAGEYALAFTINDDCEWLLTLTGKDTILLKLPLADSKEPSAMLVCRLYAIEPGVVGCRIAFGDKACVLTFRPAGDAASVGKKDG